MIKPTHSAVKDVIAKKGMDAAGEPTHDEMRSHEFTEFRKATPGMKVARQMEIFAEIWDMARAVGAHQREVAIDREERQGQPCGDPLCPNCEDVAPPPARGKLWN